MSGFVSTTLAFFRAQARSSVSVSPSKVTARMPGTSHERSARSWSCASALVGKMSNAVSRRSVDDRFDDRHLVAERFAGRGPGGDDDARSRAQRGRWPRPDACTADRCRERRSAARPRDATARPDRANARAGPARPRDGRGGPASSGSAASHVERIARVHAPRVPIAYSAREPPVLDRPCDSWSVRPRIVRLDSLVAFQNGVVAEVGEQSRGRAAEGQALAADGRDGDRPDLRDGICSRMRPRWYRSVIPRLSSCACW